eukprot:5567391-Prymnesium_polylepis.1
MRSTDRRLLLRTVALVASCVERASRLPGKTCPEVYRAPRRPLEHRAVWRLADAASRIKT